MKRPHDASPGGDTRRRRPTQAGTVPYRLRDGGVELCLITARSTGQWGFPKGNIDPGESSRETALKETWEEAGLRGVLETQVTGYAYAKSGRAHEVEMFLLRVDEVQDEWPEREQRRRTWVDIDEARRRIDRAELVPVFESAVRCIREDAAGDA